jgi:hemerythrin superfamily protein
MDAVEYLMNDHRKVEGFFKQFEQGLGLQEARQTFTQVYQELSLHALAEENVLYPALANFPDLSHQLKDSFEEHAKVKSILGELAALDMTSTDWRDKMSKLTKEVLDHVQDEESKVFPIVRQRFSSDQLQTLADELQKAKDLSRESVENSLPMREINQNAAYINSTAQPTIDQQSQAFQ